MPIDNGLGWKGLALLALVVLAACGGGAQSETDRSPSGASPVSTPTPAPTPTAVSVAYEQDVRPILATDCLSCHGQFSSYTGTMGYVIPGSASSPLVRATQPGGSMYRHLSGDQAGKSALIRRWVVENGAAQSR